MTWLEQTVIISAGILTIANVVNRIVQTVKLAKKPTD